MLEKIAMELCEGGSAQDLYHGKNYILFYWGGSRVSSSSATHRIDYENSKETHMKDDTITRTRFIINMIIVVWTLISSFGVLQCPIKTLMSRHCAGWRRAPYKRLFICMQNHKISYTVTSRLPIFCLPLMARLDWVSSHSCVCRHVLILLLYIDCMSVSFL